MKTNDIQIEVCRESVCMGDDCAAPHREEYSIGADMLMSEFISCLFEYVPTMNNSVWAVRSEDDVLGFIVTDDKGYKTYELVEDDTELCQKNKIKKVFCSYYYNGKFIYTDDNSGEKIERYPECPTLLDKVRKSLSVSC